MIGKVQHLTNNAYGFPKGQTRRVKPVALACVHITGNETTAGMADLHAAAQGERNYANRSGSDGPSSHDYVARDGWAIEAIDWRKYAAWSNGDVSDPNTANPGIRRVLALRSKGYNANEGYWLEFENVGHGPSGRPITDAQRTHCAQRIAAAAKHSGLPVNRETVHGHWEINGVDRQRCPCPPAQHESFLQDVITQANALLAPEEENVSFAIQYAHIKIANAAGAHVHSAPNIANKLPTVLGAGSVWRKLGGVVGWQAIEVGYGVPPKPTLMWVKSSDVVFDPLPLTVIDGTCPVADCSVCEQELAVANGRIHKAILDLGGTPTA